MKEFYKLTEIQISYLPRFQVAERPKVRSSTDAYEHLYESFDKRLLAFQEQSKLMLLNTNKHLLGIFHLSSGGRSATMIDPRIVFATALKAAATDILLAHNHPSGSLEPSQCDIKLTQQLCDAGELLQIKVLDHLIVTSEPGKFYSFADNNLL